MGQASSKPATSSQATSAPVDHAPSSVPHKRGREPTVDLPTKRRRRRGRPSKPRRDNRKSRYDADYTGEDEKHNDAFEAYYRMQNIVPDSEFALLLSTLATPLPTSFRIIEKDRFRPLILQKLKGEMHDLFQEVRAGKGDQGIKPPKPLPWYPDENAWTVSAPRQMLRRDNELSKFHKFLVQMNDLGAINRQEAVSMIPPLLLDVKPGHAVIDMCAAPGSKTAQVLERVMEDSGGLRSEGIVVANDADIRRCWMLAHQLKRFGSPELVITNHDGQMFPKVLQFDRVLCDVPCTGDGTMRKAPDIWRRWESGMGLGIHRLQRSILERGVDICKPGGRVVYSTCSMNPLENEAVVAHALRHCGGDLELVDVSSELPELKRRSGLTTWKVKDNSGNLVLEDSKDGNELEENGDEGKTNEKYKTRIPGWFECYDEVPLRRRKKIVASLFPPSEEELKSGAFPLQRCLRLVPHDQDTGAFFVAVLRKKDGARVHRKLQRAAEAMQGQTGDGGGTLTAGMNGNTGKIGISNASSSKSVTRIENEAVQEEDGIKVASTDGVEGNARRSKRGTRLITDDPLIAVDKLNGCMLSELTSFYGIPAELARTCLMTRGADAKTFKRIVAVTGRVRQLLEHSLGSREGSKSQVIRVVNAGVRVLERTDRRDCVVPFRIIYEGAELLSREMNKRVVKCGKMDTMYKLVKEEAVEMESMECGDLRQGLEGMESGSVIIEMHGELVVGWKGRVKVGAVMPKEVSSAVCQRLEAAQ